MTGSWWNDDAALLVALEKALSPAETVPEAVTRAASGCYAWHDVDGELAELTYDSAADDSDLARTRAEAVTLRTFTFEANEVTFELEARADSLAGLLVAPAESELELQLSKSGTLAVSTNQHGYFRISPSPTEPFRLRCLLPGNRSVSTSLITL